ncbi:hypothetical protein [Arthrobacter sp. CJ23]|uniref:hypothetical protein n=1 Tax=Arthrobacter sp. CJ23 TaxID=2972479 RepID=UPI00215D0B9D|nr:hypothetical protein [Arthrobacter sp. CJ23]UVJ40568.1 hypothetical protein NVV90_05180 [Arthrobacter sp. CJ23]
MTTTTERMLPLYEAKMIHQFDHRWATYEATGVRDVTLAERQEADFMVIPRYWVPQLESDDRLDQRWERSWSFAWRGIARSTDVRTAMASFAGTTAAGGNYDFLFSKTSPLGFTYISAAINSFVFDFVVRQKLTGMHLQFSVMNQLPVPHTRSDTGVAWSQSDTIWRWIADRAIELVYTSRDLQALANDLGYGFEPFLWDDFRRKTLRAEIDAAMFHEYGVPREEVGYILDTFPIVIRKDEAEFGEFRTKRLILEAFDSMQSAIDSGIPFESTLNPPPGQGPRHPAKDVPA